MDNSRDSSVWKSLAVTFGGGLALGAVGMKLSQTALRPAEIPARPDPPAADDRLAGMERRLERMEHSLAAPRPAAPAPASAGIDQKVLEAVVGAVDARLHEHAGQIDRRLADLEARLAIDFQNLHVQDRQAAETAAAALAEMRQEHRRSLADLRDGVSRSLAGEEAAQDQKLAEFRASLVQSMETRIVTAAAAAAANHYDERLAPLRAEVRHKEQELADLRRRLAESENAVLDVVNAIGDVCRQAATRMGRSPAPSATQPQPEPPAPAKAEAAPEAAPEAVAPPPAAEELALEVVEPPPPPPVAISSAPDFMRETSRMGTWRIPLVSSFLVAVSTGCLLLLHYL